MKTKQTIDAVAAQINTLALPSHRTFKYFSPLSLSGPTGALVPALAVAPQVRVASLESTYEADYSADDRLRVTWYAAQMSAPGIGVADEAAAGAALDHVALIVNEIQTWTDGVTGLTAYQNEATLIDTHWGHIEGGIWACEINISVKEWEL